MAAAETEASSWRRQSERTGVLASSHGGRLAGEGGREGGRRGQYDEPNKLFWLRSTSWCCCTIGAILVEGGRSACVVFPQGWQDGGAVSSNGEARWGERQRVELSEALWHLRSGTLKCFQVRQTPHLTSLRVRPPPALAALNKGCWREPRVAWPLRHWPPMYHIVGTCR